MDIFLLAEAPIFILCFYIFIRDKYEKEPKRLLITGLTLGCLFAIPILFSELFLLKFTPQGKILENIYKSFFVASFTEEMYKFFVLFLLVWKNKNFNERFDGVVYSVFIALGFAGVENYLFVTNNIENLYYTSVSRGIISVPAHFFYAIFMGYYISYAKFEKNYYYLFISFLIPFILHGLFDLIILMNFSFNLILLIILLIIMAINSFFKMAFLLDLSPFKNIK